MATRQITCPTCSHAFAVAADARTAICPRCGKALPILSSGISLDFQLPPKKAKGEKPKAPAPPPPPPPPPAAPDAKLARISLRKASGRPSPRGFEDLSAVTRPANPHKSAVDLPPAPEATIPGERGFHVEILPRGHRDRDAATGVDLPLRPPGAFIDPSQYPESGVGADEPTAVPRDGELIEVESGEWPHQEPEQVIHDDTWSEAPIDEIATAPEAPAPPLPPLPSKGVPSARPRAPVPPARRPPPPPRPPPLPPTPAADDDPKVTAMRLKAIDDEPPEAGPPEAGPPGLGPPEGGPPGLGPPDLGPPDLGPPDLGPPDLGSDFGARAELGPRGVADPPSDLGADLPTELGDSRPEARAPAARSRTASYHRDLSPSQRVAALTNAIDDEVSREVAIPPQRSDSAVYPPPQTPGTMTNLGLGPSAVDDDGAPLVLPDTGIMVFVPDQPIEERAIGEEKPAPATPRYKSGGTLELSPLQQRRKPLAAGGHGVATRRGPSRELVGSPTRSKLWIVLALGTVLLVGLGVGLVVFLR